MSKTTCPISRDHFRANAKPLLVCIDGKDFLAMPKESENTGSLILNANDKIILSIGGVPTKFQLSVNLTAVGSKELPK